VGCFRLEQSMSSIPATCSPSPNLSPVDPRELRIGCTSRRADGNPPVSECSSTTKDRWSRRRRALRRDRHLDRQRRAWGNKLHAEKGINLPDTSSTSRCWPDDCASAVIVSALTWWSLLRAARRRHNALQATREDRRDELGIV